MLVWAAAVPLIGGACSVLRFLVDSTVGARFARSFPLGTLTVNLSGAAALGVITELGLKGNAALLAGTAAVGSYTSFSTWMLETRTLTAERQRWIATINVVAGVTLGVGAALIGQIIAEQF